MFKYCVICISELDRIETNFVCMSATRLFSTLEAAVEYGKEWCERVSSYPALCDFYVYELLSDDIPTSSLSSLRLSAQFFEDLEDPSEDSEDIDPSEEVHT